MAPGYGGVTMSTPFPRGADRPDEDGAVQLHLRDGSRVLVRPIRPEDKARLEQGLDWLSPRSRYLRFHSQVQRLTASQLTYLTEIDHHDHEALVALDPDRPDLPGVGVARYIRTDEDPTIAEAAVTVVDDYQGRGIGTALLGLLEPLARERGIHTFRNYVLAENRTMLDIFTQLDGELVLEGPGLYRVDVPIPEDPAAQPDTPAGRWVTSVGRAQGPERDGSWAYPVLWLVRRLREELPLPHPSRLLKAFAADEPLDLEMEDGELDGPELERAGKDVPAGPPGPAER